MQTKEDLDKYLLGEAFLRDKEVLLFPEHISINETADYRVQVCQVSHRDLGEILGNMVDVIDKSGAVVHLNALVPGMGSVKTSFFQNLVISCTAVSL